MRRVVIAPHADDEAMGCGGLLAKYPSECHVVIVAEPDQERFAEFLVARSVLGYASDEVLGWPDGRLGDQPAALVEALDWVLATQMPVEVYLPYPSAHQDHVAVYEAGVRACRMSMTANHWFPPSVFVYDVAAYDLTLYPTDLRWNVFESLTEEQVDRKAAACEGYESQTPAGPHPMSTVKGIAAAIGSQRRVAWAEQYALLRSVR